VKGAGQSALALVALMMSTTGSGLAVQQSADQGTPAAQEQAPPKPAAPTRVRVSKGVMQGLLVKRVQPKYPEEAREDRIQGTVVLHALISKEGDVIGLWAVSGDPLLVKAAIKVVKQWKYKPYLLNGQAVEVYTEVLVNFTLVGN